MESIKVRTVKYIVGKYFNINVDRKTRKIEYIKARMICYKILREECNFRLADIGRYFKRHHATIYNGLKEFNGISLYDKKFKEDYESICLLWNDPQREDTGGISTVSKLEINEKLQKLNKEFIYLSDSVDVLKSEIKELNKEIKEKYLELEKK